MREKMNWPGSKTLFLKKNCRTMLIWNKSDLLKNDTRGIFKGVSEDGDKLQIQLEKVYVQRKTWFQRNQPGEKIGSVVQYPVILAYAITCHKAQGLELDAVVLHSSKEFVTGLVYVATSRLKSAEALQVIGFKANQILPADPEVIKQCSRTPDENDPSLFCCRN